jgi:hypothetical protein
MFNKIVSFFHNLRLLFLAVIIVTLLYNFGLNPVNVGRYVGAQFGRAVGLSVGVPENPFNKLALQLEEKEDQLNVREKSLNEQEAKLAAQAEVRYSPLLTGLTIGVIILFLLVIFNYYLDYRRKKRAEKNKP